MSDRKCISCGMPLTRPTDHAKGDVTRDWCVHCADAEGDLKPWEAVVEGMTAFIVRGQGLDEGVARDMAERMLVTMPAWRDRA